MKRLMCQESHHLEQRLCGDRKRLPRLSDLSRPDSTGVHAHHISFIQRPWSPMHIEAWRRPYVTLFKYEQLCREEKSDYQGTLSAVEKAESCKHIRLWPDQLRIMTNLLFTIWYDLSHAYFCFFLFASGDHVKRLWASTRPFPHSAMIGSLSTMKHARYSFRIS